MAEKEYLIQELIRIGYLKTPRIIKAFRAVDRKDFVLPEHEREAYGNFPLPIGFGQTISQPLTVAFMLELLDPRPGEHILDIGAGSGWQTALLAHVVSEAQTDADSTRTDADKILRKSASSQRESAGHVVAIERIPELAAMAEQNIQKYDFLKRGVVRVFTGDGSRGAPEESVPSGGFHKIIAAAAARNVPAAWAKQLKIGGHIVAPVGHSIVVLDKKKNGALAREEYYGFAFVPLIEDTKDARDRRD